MQKERRQVRLAVHALPAETHGAAKENAGFAKKMHILSAFRLQIPES